MLIAPLIRRALRLPLSAEHDEQPRRVLDCMGHHTRAPPAPTDDRSSATRNGRRPYRTAHRPRYWLLQPRADAATGLTAHHPARHDASIRTPLCDRIRIAGHHP